MKEQSFEIIIDEVEVEVFFDFQPEEKAVMYDSNGTGYPGCHAEVYINGVEHKGEDIISLLSEKQIEEIEEEVFKSLSEL